MEHRLNKVERQVVEIQTTLRHLEQQQEAILERQGKILDSFSRMEGAKGVARWLIYFIFSTIAAITAYLGIRQ